MNFLGLKKLSKEKRNELIVVVLITIMVLTGLGYGLIRYQYRVLAQLAEKKVQGEQKLEQMTKTIKYTARDKADLDTNSQQLAEVESVMASGDLYSWFIAALRPFKQSYRLDIPQIGQPSAGEMTLLPKFPYRQATLNLAGTGRFYELGRFISDVENKFPYLRVVNLDLEPTASAADKETLAFRMDIIVLIKPNAS